ncbi:MAG: magnesium transporter CorA family protein [Pseudomonadota bacterium]
MLRCFSTTGVKEISAYAADVNTVVQAALWIDLLNPSREEERVVEQALGGEVPTREEMQEIETSSRLYEENGILFMTATVLINADTSTPESTPATFILMPNRLVTLRYADSSPFRNMANLCAGKPQLLMQPAQLMTSLLDAIVDRMADLLERTSTDLDSLSRQVFGVVDHKAKRRSEVVFRELLTAFGRNGDLVARIRESLTSLTRLHNFLVETERLPNHPELREHLSGLRADLLSLADHAAFLSNKIAFLLDATLGLVSIEQNTIIKTLAVAGTVFLPPTLIASIYGMNFEHMPELAWPWAYPLSLLLIIASGAVPYWFFKRKGWI